MLRFQTEDDAQTGEKVLTCYLLPQRPPPGLLGRLRGRGRAGPGQAGRPDASFPQRTRRRGAALPRAGATPRSAASASSSSWRPPRATRTPRRRPPRSGYGGVGSPGGPAPPGPASPRACLPACLPQGLQRRATPHPSELKVMKRGVERRSEAASCRPEPRPPSPSPPPSVEVPLGTRGAQEGCLLGRPGSPRPGVGTGSRGGRKPSLCCEQVGSSGPSASSLPAGQAVSTVGRWADTKVGQCGRAGPLRGRSQRWPCPWWLRRWKSRPMSPCALGARVASSCKGAGWRQASQLSLRSPGSRAASPWGIVGICCPSKK